jgi:hypothetical protein
VKVAISFDIPAKIPGLAGSFSYVVHANVILLPCTAHRYESSLFGGEVFRLSRTDKNTVTSRIETGYLGPQSFRRIPRSVLKSHAKPDRAVSTLLLALRPIPAAT